VISRGDGRRPRRGHGDGPAARHRPGEDVRMRSWRALPSGSARVA